MKGLRRSVMPAVLGLLVVVGFLGAVGYTLIKPAAVISPQAASLLETLKWAVAMVLGYFVGSSVGSAEKTSLLAPGKGPPDGRPSGTA